ncbi:thioredoxin domain-containing protein [Kaistia dalseonensis]|uniref:Uncharacterized protein YyaL (SSP411 family) n=1 Tax=Kaistia dalseonensis TaxID=410840 RepID=A0ABU0H551_9HYPH|nr:thioredoxin domain-containing protein [Kaistia dalseonensis]MCX5494836.1 thioredoxin domain-containing protein [Kaistia dalseonensis]MDQ0437417.1 uncharacterized protein YyaL (SSP411 family) [Kaistia dalseonensis]
MSGNLLQYETSPYLLQHRDNPVHWRGWNEAAFAEARQLDRPVLLSIGYAACHWCHVMAHESFEDEATAALMNRLFVNIKVDREERPDIDQIYMAALHALGDQGGWPLTMFLTPTARPIWGGTYFPNEARYGKPSFRQVLTEIARLYAEDRDAILAQADSITAHLAKPRPDAGSVPLDEELLDRAGDAILNIMDREKGGTRGAPKFPNTPVLDFLARCHERTGRADLAAIVDTTLAGMSQGGIFDHVGGGFARYSVDAEWLVPHFEKMLSDNGLLLERLALATRISPRADLFRDRIETTIGWLLREMQLEGGAFAASLDADSGGGEGRFYVWRRAEFDALLGPDDAAFIAALYDITPAGNWEHVSIPNRLATPESLGAADDLRRRRILAELRVARDQRPRPALDDKILVDWNGYAIAGLALAGQLLGEPLWVAHAETAYRFITESVARDGRLGHALRAGKMVHPGFSSDLATMAHAAFALHQATQRARYVADAIRFLDDLDAHHRTADGGYHLTADDGEAVIIRKSDRTDDATPNPHGLAADTLIRLWAYSGDDRFRARADAILAGSAANIVANVFGTASLLGALDLRLRVRTVVIIVPPGTTGRELRAVVDAHWRSDIVLDLRDDGDLLSPAHPAFGKSAIESRATAYVCQEGRCSLPVTEAADLAALLEGRAGTVWSPA